MHTTRSDGDSSPEQVVAWYAHHKYDWLALTDHWQGVTEDYATALSEQYGILVIPGIELGGSTHVVGLNIKASEPYDANWDKAPAKHSLHFGVDWINTHGGLAIMAHPTWTYMWGSEDALAVPGCKHFEVLNGSSDCNSFAAGGKKGTDEIWNDILNAGRLMYGVGSDDAHRHSPQAILSEHYGGFGASAWTLVQCSTLTRANILSAFNSGRIVASNGPRIFDFGIADNTYFVKINEPYEHFYFTTRFYGSTGILAEINGRNPAYAIRGDERWIRARVFCTSGKYLWTQPIYI